MPLNIYTHMATPEEIRKKNFFDSFKIKGYIIV